MGNIGRTAVLATAATALALAGSATFGGTSGANGVVARAELRDGAGSRVGEVRFRTRDGAVTGEITVALPTDSARFHGFHLGPEQADAHLLQHRALACVERQAHSL